MLVKVIFAFGTLATLIALVLKYKKDRNTFLLVLGGIGIAATVFCFILTSMDLAQFKAPRRISVEQRTRIAEKMKEFAGQEYTGMIGPGVADAWDLWREISLSLDLAGWKLWCCVSKAVDSQYGPPATIWPAALGGVHIFWPTLGGDDAMLPPAEQQAKWLKAEERRPPAQALAEALTAEGLPAFAGPMTEISNHPLVVISIGPKPQK